MKRKATHVVMVTYAQPHNYISLSHYSSLGAAKKYANSIFNPKAKIDIFKKHLTATRSKVSLEFKEVK